MLNKRKWLRPLTIITGCVTLVSGSVYAQDSTAEKIIEISRQGVNVQGRVTDAITKKK